jgi:hypothetical protein
MSRVRTNIEIEDTYLHAVMDRYGGAHAIAEIPEDTHPLGAA